MFCYWHLEPKSFLLAKLFILFYLFVFISLFYVNLYIGNYMFPKVTVPDNTDTFQYNTRVISGLYVIGWGVLQPTPVTFMSIHRHSYHLAIISSV